MDYPSNHGLPNKAEPYALPRAENSAAWPAEMLDDLPPTGETARREALESVAPLLWLGIGFILALGFGLMASWQWFPALRP